jgi:PAS domain-containing protein
VDKLLTDLYHALQGHRWLKYTPFQAWGDRVKLRNRIARRQKLVIEEPLRNKYREVLKYLTTRNDPSTLGDYVEFGVYNGTSLITMYRVLEEFGCNHIRLFGFDSFEGLPSTAKEDDEGVWHPGQYKSEYDFTMEVLRSENLNMQRVFLTRGFFEDTLTDDVRARYGLRKAGIIMVDSDLYLSAKTVLEFCVPLIADETVIIFDDWHFFGDRNLGEKRAFAEFLQAYPCFEAKDFGTYPRTGQVFVVSRKASMVSNLNAPAWNHAMMVRNRDGTIRYWSEGARNMYGWETRKALGKVSHRLLRTVFPMPLQDIETELLTKGCWEGELIHERIDRSKIRVTSRWEVQEDVEAKGQAATVIEINKSVKA